MFCTSKKITSHSCQITMRKIIYTHTASINISKVYNLVQRNYTYCVMTVTIQVQSEVSTPLT